ncbi:SseB family protein [Arthrobacter sp. UM1]|uniref:SseB family protein n=1 Tax=Arthrobacter sp. UM1 TaxID=2766776 RepID=UPI001CF6BE9F|nr:SseB family protein [Arthrobacter sp. UM1]MCB4208115.1 SseB family protein [Arthrobacter sp. UM1]
MTGREQPPEPRPGAVGASADGTGAPSGRRLPGHIASALEQQKNRIASGRNLTDTAGQPWAGRTFEHSRPEDPADDGRADPRLAEALRRWGAAEAEETEVVSALPGTRVFVAARAQHSPEHASTDDGHAGDKAADMVLCSLTAPDGRRALPVFTSAEAVTAWASDARPIPFEARRVALSCVQDGAQLMVLDPGTGPGFVVRRPAVWAVAQGEEWVPSYESPEIRDSLAAAAQSFEDVAALVPARGPRADGVAEGGLRLRGGGLGPELECHVFVHSGLTREALAGLMERVSRALTGSEAVARLADSMALKVLDAALLEGPG